MTDSERSLDRRQPDAENTPSASNGNQPNPAHNGETPPPPPSREELETQRKIQELEAGEANVRFMNAIADAAEAAADKAWSDAEAEPKRQKMSLRERGVKIGLLALFVLAAIGLEIALFIVSPWLIALNLPVIAVTALRRFRVSKEEEERSLREEKGGEP